MQIPSTTGEQRFPHAANPLTHLLLGGALVAGGYVLGSSNGSRNTAFAAPQGAVAGVNAWGIAVETNGWALVKGEDGKAYKVTPTGWTTAGAQGQGPLQLH